MALIILKRALYIQLFQKLDIIICKLQLMRYDIICCVLYKNHVDFLLWIFSRPGACDYNCTRQVVRGTGGGGGAAG